MDDYFLRSCSYTRITTYLQLLSMKHKYRKFEPTLRITTKNSFILHDLGLENIGATYGINIVPGFYVNINLNAETLYLISSDRKNNTLSTYTDRKMKYLSHVEKLIKHYDQKILFFVMVRDYMEFRYGLSIDPENDPDNKVDHINYINRDSLFHMLSLVRNISLEDASAEFAFIPFYDESLSFEDIKNDKWDVVLTKENFDDCSMLWNSNVINSFVVSPDIYEHHKDKINNGKLPFISGSGNII